jgi:hypothetical protein
MTGLPIPWICFPLCAHTGTRFSVTLDAQRARGYEIERVEGGLIAQNGKIAPLIVPVTMNSIISGEDVTMPWNCDALASNRAPGLKRQIFTAGMLYLMIFTGVHADFIIVLSRSSTLVFSGCLPG